jgi:lysophospholipase L1-like esterase
MTEWPKLDLIHPAPSAVLRGAPVCAMTVFAILACAIEATPSLRALQIFPAEGSEIGSAEPKLPSSSLSVGEATLNEESHSSATERSTLGTKRASGPIAGSGKLESLSDADIKAPPVAIEDPSGQALRAFFERLGQTEARRNGAITRILHFGDSIVASDLVSGTLRRRFQEQFGDAGHGFTLIANAWPAYFHEGVSRFATSGWQISRVVGPLASDGWHGLGGVSFKAPPHLLARIGTAKKGELGRRVSRFEVAYVESPDGGQADVRIDGKPETPLDTRAATKRFRSVTYHAADGEHELEIQTTHGTSRFFGVVMEREQPGIVLDAVGILGARIRFLDKQDDAHFREQLVWRDPALVVYQFGANESADGYAYSMTDYYETMKAVVVQQRQALPNTSCLILGAMDRAARKGDELRSLSIIPLLVEQQRRVAGDVGCAFFDIYRAMGGEGSMPKWFKRDLGQSDLTHPTAEGAELIGNWIFRALMQARREMPSDR